MKLLLIGLTLVISTSAFGANWRKLKAVKYGGCMASYAVSMQEKSRTNKTHVEVTTSRNGWSPTAVLELTTSSSKSSLPTDGGYLDLFVERIKTVRGVDHWKECTVDPRELAK